MLLSIECKWRINFPRECITNNTIYYHDHFHSWNIIRQVNKFMSSSNFISNKYMKTSIYNTLALMITAMFICTLLVATRKSRGLSSWLPRNVTNSLVTRPPGPTRRSWHIGTLEVVSRNEFYRMDFTLSNHWFYYGLYLVICHFIRCFLNVILHLYVLRSLCISFHNFAPLILTALSPRVNLAGGISSCSFWRKS